MANPFSSCKIRRVGMRKYLPFALVFGGLAFAHPGHFHAANPFSSGFTHPLTGIDHIAVMVAVGLLGSYLTGKKSFAPAISFVSFMAIGAFLGMLGLPIPFVETGIVLSVALMGLILLVKDIKLLYILPLIAMFGFLHGNAHGIEAPQTANPILYTLGFILSTSILHLSGILLGKTIKERFVKLAGLSLLLLALAL